MCTNISICTYKNRDRCGNTDIHVYSLCKGFRHTYIYVEMMYMFKE